MKNLRGLQKKIMNHYVDFGDMNQKCINDEILLLALGGQVPIDKLLLRLEKLKKIELANQVDLTEYYKQQDQIRNTFGGPTGVVAQDYIPAPENDI